MNKLFGRMNWMGKVATWVNWALFVILLILFLATCFGLPLIEAAKGL